MLLEIFKLETTMTIIHGSLSVLRMRHLRPRKAKGPTWGEAHTAGEGLTWIHHSAPLPRGVSLELFQACQAHLVSPSLCSCLSPPTLSLQVESGSCQQRERKAPEVRCEAESGVSPVLRIVFISNKIWATWFNASQEIAIMVPDSTANKCYFSCTFPTV